MLSITKRFIKKTTLAPIYYFAAKELSFGQECRFKMLMGCDKLADAV
jgi:chaperonin GroEL